jgi:hypothetical protein
MANIGIGSSISNLYYQEKNTQSLVQKNVLIIQIPGKLYSNEKKTQKFIVLPCTDTSFILQ